MRRILDIIILCALAIGAVSWWSCERGIDSTLDRADSLFDSNIDSAYNIIASIDTSRLNDRQKAIRELLFVRYHFFTHNPDFPDSISDRHALEILKYDDSKWIFEYYHWKGMRLCGRGRFVEALNALDRGEYYLKKIKYPESDKNAILGHINFARANIWMSLGNIEQARRYMDLANDSYSRTGLAMTMGYSALLAKIELYTLFNQHREVLELIDSIRMVYPDNKKFINKCLVKGLPALYYTQQYDSVRNLIARMQQDSMFQNSTDVLYARALMEAHDGNYDRTGADIDEIISYFESRGINSYGLIRWLNLKKDNYLALGDYKRAFEVTSHINDYYRGRLLDDRGNLAVESSKEFYADRLLVSEKEARSHRTIVLLIILAALLAITGLIFAVVYIRNRNRNHLAGMVAKLENLKIKDEENRQSIASLVSSRFETFNRLCDSYFEMYDLDEDVTLKNELLKNIKSLVQEMRSPKFRNELEQKINTDLDNLCFHFRKITGVTREEETLFVYLVAGFSVKAIGVFMNLKKSSVYTRRRRLREKIEASGSQYADELIKYL